MIRTIRFKSTPENFSKEFSGRKNNTVRFTEDWNEKRWNDFHNARFVEIVQRGSKNSFKREISDKTIYKNVAIISW